MKEFEGKKLLVLGGIKLACDIVEHAQKMGVYVVVADYLIDSPAKKIADEAVLLDATNVDLIVEYCQKNNIDGVTTGFVDILLPVCYEVCRRLGLPYYATELMIEMSTNKTVFKDKCVENGLPVPKTYLVGSIIPDEIYEQISYPVFVKPLDASGSRGAAICNNKEEVEMQFEEAKSFSKTNRAIIEDYLVGREFLLDYVGVDGKFKLLSIFDRYMGEDRDSARNYANVSLCPSKAVDFYYSSINKKVIQMFRNLGFRDGLIFMQGHYDGSKITFYEMGCRLGGSFYALEQKCLGFNPVDMIVRYALSGKMLSDINIISDDSAKFKKVAMVSNYLLKGDDETIHNIEGIEKVKEQKAFVSLIQQRVIGDHYCKDKTVDKPAVSFSLVYDDLQDAKEGLDYMNTVMKIENEKGESLLMQKLDSDSIL